MHVILHDTHKLCMDHPILKLYQWVSSWKLHQCICLTDKHLLCTHIFMTANCIWFISQHTPAMGHDTYINHFFPCHNLIFHSV